MLFEKIEETDPIDRNEIPFVSREDAINDLYQKITASYKSINKLSLIHIFARLPVPTLPHIAFRRIFFVLPRDK